MTRSIMPFATLAFAFAGCGDGSTAPINVCVAQQVRAADSLATAQWNTRTRALVSKYRSDPSARPYALVSVAQLNATTAVEARAVQPCPSVRSAVASASAVVLAYLYPAETATLEAAVREQHTADSTLGARGLAEGEALGRQAAEPVLAVARADGVDAVFTGSVPTGAGFWWSSSQPSTPPTTPMLGKMRPWVLSSGDQFRPGAPPAFGSPEYKAALAEVKSIVAGRTAEQLAKARQWALAGGTFRTQGQWNLVTSDLVQARHPSEFDAAHTFALVNMAMNDASIACFDAKYAYWFIRPSQADPTIATAISLPNHPSYPSSHSCTSGAGSDVLAALYPSESTRLRALADEIGMSRLYAGIHYRFDIDTGLSLGRRVARAVLDADAQGRLLASLR